MPTSPPPPLSFRTSGFPQYGWKAGLSGGAFPRSASVKPHPGMPSAPPGLPPPFVLRVAASSSSALCRKPPARWSTTMRAAQPLYPRGPRSGSGYSVPIHHRLPDPIRPTRRHTTISPSHGLYAMPSLCGCAGSDPRVVPCFRCPLCLDMSPAETPGSPSAACAQFLRRRHWPSPRYQRLGTPKRPSSASDGGYLSRLARFAFAHRSGYDLPSCSLPLADPTDPLGPADRSFYARASTRSITLPAARYNYGGNWASSAGGTSTRKSVS